MTGSIVGFNYDVLEETLRAKARENAGKIHKALKRSTAAVVEIGRHLIEVHDSLGRQHFQAWLKAEFRWTQATASTYEAVARKFGDLACLDQFNPSALSTLARLNIDPRVVKEAIKRAQAGEIITRVHVVKIIRKFLLKPIPGAKTEPATGKPAALPGVLNAPLTDLRSFVRRLDITTIPADQRQQLSEELLELAMQLRSGRKSDGAPVAGKRAADVEEPAPVQSPTRPRPAARRRQPVTGPETLKCA